MMIVDVILYAAAFIKLVRLNYEDDGDVVLRLCNI